MSGGQVAQYSILLNGADITGFANAIDYSIGNNPIENTTFGDSTKISTPGLVNFKAQLRGLMSPLMSDLLLAFLGTISKPILTFTPAKKGPLVIGDNSISVVLNEDTAITTANVGDLVRWDMSISPKSAAYQTKFAGVATSNISDSISYTLGKTLPIVNDPNVIASFTHRTSTIASSFAQTLKMYFNSTQVGIIGSSLSVLSLQGQYYGGLFLPLTSTSGIANTMIQETNGAQGSLVFFAAPTI